ncbi:hypothetical protein ACC668_33140 [Rhizobium ruizarguesonis]
MPSKKKRVKIELNEEQKKLIAKQLGVDWDALVLSKDGFSQDELSELGGEKGVELNIVVALGATKTVS